MRILVVFPSARAAAKAEMLCNSNNIVSKVTPLPEDISSECGMALYINKQQINIFKSIMQQNKIEIHIYERE